MKLGEKQEMFAQCLWRLLHKVEQLGYDARVGEVFRPPEMAAIYAKRGQGIKNSLHCKKLAADIFIFERGEPIWDGEPYDSLGEFWKGLHELCCWGGDFLAYRDVYHFSITHGGVK